MRIVIARLTWLLSIALIALGCDSRRYPTEPDRTHLDSSKAVATDSNRNAGTPTDTASPTIRDIVPTAAKPGATIIIRGDGFGSMKTTVSVSFGDVPAEVMSVAMQQIAVRVPLTARTGSIHVIVKGKQGASTPWFTVNFAPELYMQASIRIAGISVYKHVLYNEQSLLTGQDIAHFSGGQVETYNYDEAVVGCGTHCDSVSATDTTIDLCCQQGTLIRQLVIEVDTARRVFSSITFTRQISEGGTGLYRESNSKVQFQLRDVPYGAYADGGLIATVYSPDFQAHIVDLWSSDHWSVLTPQASGDIAIESYTYSRGGFLPSPAQALIQVILKR